MPSVDAIEQEITAWAFAHDVDGASRNELMRRVRAMHDAAPPAAMAEDVMRLIAKLRSSTRGLGSEDPANYIPRGITAADCHEAAALLTRLAAPEAENLDAAWKLLDQAIIDVVRVRLCERGDFLFCAINDAKALTKMPSSSVEDAGSEAYRQGYRDGFVDARFPEGPPDEEAEAWRGIDSVAMADGWQNYRDTFQAALQPQPVDVVRSDAGR